MNNITGALYGVNSKNN